MMICCWIVDCGKCSQLDTVDLSILSLWPLDHYMTVGRSVERMLGMWERLVLLYKKICLVLGFAH